MFKKKNNLIFFLNLFFFFTQRYFNDNEIKSTQKTRIDTKGPTSTLTINKADMPDIGVYKVVADNGKEKIETKANIDVCGM